jgi:ribosome-associated protein
MAEIELRTMRSSGPGGQHANVTDSRVEVVFDVVASQALSAAQRDRLLNVVGTRVEAMSQEGRGQARNRDMALSRLADRIAAGLEVPRERRPTRPTRASKRRRLETKRKRSTRKQLRRKPGFDD